LRRDESGFGVAEAVLATGILFVALMALVGASTVALTDVALARQRQTANGVANQTLEVVRGLSYARVALGLADVEPGNVALTADPNVVSCSGTYYFKTCPAVNPASEQIVHTPGVTATCASPCVEPLVPHRGTVGPPNYPDTYTWSVYVTKALSVPSAGAFRVTVIVSWTGAARAGVASSIQTQSLIYQPSGSVDPSTHVIGTTDAFFYGTGSVTGGSVVTTPNTTVLPNGIANLPQLEFVHHRSLQERRGPPG